jgi:DNA-binding beta-propeller fold protein YncE
LNKPTGRFAFVFVSLIALASSAPQRAKAQPSYWLFESMPSRPLALSSDAQRLYAVNTPDGYLEIFDVSGDTPVRAGAVPVGLEPVAVSLRTDGEAWVVNHLSDSISIVDVAATPPRVVRTLLVGDAPSDVIFAGTERGRAFVTTAHRGQNTSDPLGAYATAGIGRADVWIFDAVNPPTDLFAHQSATILSLFTDRPRALAASPDGTVVYAAGFMTGNRTTIVSEGIVCNGATVGTCTTHGGGTAPGGMPAPRTNHQGLNAPETGLIVRSATGTSDWLDELGRDWSPFVRFDLPDYDVFAIDADAVTPSVTTQIAGVGTVLFAMATNPITGRLYVANTDAMNHVRFEGHGDYVRDNEFKPAGEPATVRGHLHEARITIVNGSTATPRHLNAHLDYDAMPQPASARDLSIAQPMGLEVSADGETLYVAGFGSNALSVIPTDALEAGTYVPSATNIVGLTGGGPTGLVLDGDNDRVFVATRYDDGISVVSTVTNQETAHVVMHTPEPASVVWGRPILYDARFASSTGEASCGSCHVFGDVDGLGWDLGDPDGNQFSATNPVGPIALNPPVHPMKGPMTTQTFRSMSTHGPMHWRGDRTAGGVNATDEHAAFVAFNAAFPGLLGRDEGEISDEEMDLFADFVLQIDLPPNPIRQLDNSLRANEQAGRTFYFNANVDTVATCNGCHVLDAAQGFFGTSGLMTFENETQEFKVAHLRNLYEKVGMFGMPNVDFFSFEDGETPHTGAQVRGFGYLHDGSADTTFNFFHASVFTGFGGTEEVRDQNRRNMEAFMMVFDTDLAPIVGQQVTVDGASTAAELARLDLLHARSGTPFVLHGATNARECDLVAHGVVNGEQRGFLRQPNGTYASDRASEPARSKDELIALAAASGQYLTFTCTPPGSGTRVALDRDEDGTRNMDDTDPTDRPLTTTPIVPTPDAGTSADAGADAGADASADAGTSGGGGGCGCVTAGTHANGGHGSMLGALVVLALGRLRRGRARRAPGVRP